MISKLFLVATAATLLPHAALAATATDVAAAFGPMPTADGMRISPDGRRVSYLNMSGEKSVLFVADVETGSAAPILRSSDNANFTSCDWLTDDRLTCQAAGQTEIGTIGDIVNRGLTVAVDADGSDMTVLGQRNSSRNRYQSLNTGRIIHRLPDDPEHVLMQVYLVPDDAIGTRVGSRDEGPAVAEVDIRTNRMKTVLGPIQNASTFIADGSGEVRVYGLSEVSPRGNLGDRYIYKIREPGSRDWRTLAEADLSNAASVSIEGFGDNGKTAYMLMPHAGRQALFKEATAGGQLELVWAHEDVDADGLVSFGEDRRPVGVAWSDEYNHIEMFDPTLKQIQDALHGALGGDKEITLLDASADENRILLLASAPDDPGTFYIYDRAAKQVFALADARQPLQGHALANMEPITYPAADGADVPAFLTLPPGVTRDSAKNLPVIILPHGGPSARDTWGFDWLSQAMAGLGYAVIQPNFRGSTGYGFDWYGENALKGWRTAINDINDAARWAVSSGLGDPDKTVILGWSYGGYAALQANVVDPKLYKAAVAIAPVTDLDYLKADAAAFSNQRLIERAIGNGPHVAAGSPRQHAGEIAVPVLMVHGDRDVNVPVRHSREMAEALQRAGKPVEYVEIEGFDHYLESGKVRMKLIEDIARFLKGATGS